jgi:hypothetical protein
MGKAFDTVSFTATAPGAGGAALYTALPGDSLQIRNGKNGTRVRIVQHWGNQNVAGFQQVVYSSGNDTTRNYRANLAAALPLPLIPFGSAMEIQPQETMLITGAGSAVAGQIENGSLLVAYEDLPGTDANLIDTAELTQRAVQLLTVQMTLTPTANGQYSGAAAINSTSDLLRAITDYAILGATFQTANQLIGIRSPDWGNLRISIPASTGDPRTTANWFADLSDWLAMPLIPVFNSGNKGSVFLDTVTNQGGTATTFSLMLVQLTPKQG